MIIDNVSCYLIDYNGTCDDFGVITLSSTEFEDIGPVNTPATEEQDNGSVTNIPACSLPFEIRDKIVEQQATTFPIVDVNDTEGFVVILGNWEWLFQHDYIFEVATSVNNYTPFVVDYSVYNSQFDNTYIYVQSPNVNEAPSGSPQDVVQYFYNPGMIVKFIDNVTNTVIRDGNVASSYQVGMKVKIFDSVLPNNNGIWTVANVTYNETLDETYIQTQEDIPNISYGSPIPPVVAKISTPIWYHHVENKNNYIQDLGYILGAVYDGTNAIEDGNPRTIVVPSTPAEQNITGFEYTWLGPIRIETILHNNNNVFTNFVDYIGSTDELMLTPQRIEIIDTSVQDQTIRIKYVDPETNANVNLTDMFTPGEFFVITHSHDYSYQYTNDFTYVVDQSWFDVNSGETTIRVSNDFDVLPPYNSINIIDIQDTNEGSPATVLTQLILEGDVTSTFQQVFDQMATIGSYQYFIDVPLVNNNIITVTSVELINGNTVITIDDAVSDYSYTGEIKLADIRFNYMLHHGDDTITNWTSGYVSKNQLDIQTRTDISTDTTFKETIDFGWGATYNWAIGDVSQNIIYINGNISSQLINGDNISITGSDSIDGNYIIQSVLFNSSTNNTEILVIGENNQNVEFEISGTPQILGSMVLENIDITNWFQYLIVESNPSIGSPLIQLNGFKVFGNVTNDLQINQQFRVKGTTNDGLYTVSNVLFDPNINISIIQVFETVQNHERGGWIESHRDQGIVLALEDHVGVSVSENATGALMLTSGNFIDAWDYNLWSVGGYDEDLQTLELYSSTL